MKKLFAVILSLGLILAPVPVVNTAHAGSAGGYAKMLLGMANGIIGSTVLTKCKLGTTQLSILIYMAGGLVYTFAEIAGGKAKSKATENNANDVANFQANMKDGGDLQKKAIDAQIKNEEDNLKHVQTKRKWMMATKLVYAAATAMAIIEIWWQLPSPVGLNKSFQAACTPNPASNSLMTSAISVAYGAFVSSGGSLQGMLMAGAAGAGQKYFAAKAMETAAKTAGKTVAELQATAAAAETASVPLLNSAPSRIAFFAAATAIVMFIDGDLKKEEKDIKGRIADLKKVKSTFEAADNNLEEGASTSGTGATAGSGSGDENDPSKKKYEVNGLAKGIEMKKSCFTTSSSGATDYSEAGCNSPLRLQKPNFPGGVDLPTLQSAALVSTDMANAISSGDIASADLEAGKLAAMGAKIESVKDSVLKKYNDQMKKEGKKPVDVNGEIKRQVAALNAQLNKQNPGSGNYSAADIGDAGAAATSETAAADDVAASAITTAAAPAAEPVAEGIDLSKLESDALGGTEVVDPNAANGKVASLEDSLGAYESNEGDIAQDTGVSIFKQVSNRYILNYEKIFQRKQINPPLADPQPSN